MKISWLPFELHPEAPIEGIPRETYFGRSRSLQMHDHLQSVAAEVGLVMKQRDVIINTRLALAAAEFARESGHFDAMHHALFKAHWELTGRLEVVDDLVRIGTEVGLDGSALREAIEDGRYAGVLDASRADAEAAGINAIPAHVFGRRYLVVGAHPYETFVSVLERLGEPRASS